jgi:hypothetical protein
MNDKQNGSPEIGLLNEKSLHAALKRWYAQPGDRFEESVDGFVIDIVRGHSMIEIQTSSFYNIRNKLYQLVERHPVRLVYPIAKEKWLLKLSSENGAPVIRRKSPKKGRVEDLFKELVSCPGLVNQPNFSIEVLLIQEEETRRHDQKRGWRRKGWVTEERRLVKVIGRHVFEGRDAYCALLPDNLPDPFTNQHLKESLDISTRLAGQITYCLREMGCIALTGKKNRYNLHSRKQIK